MITLNQPPLSQDISIPKDMTDLSVEAFTAGIVEGVLDGLDLVSGDQDYPPTFGAALILDTLWAYWVHTASSRSLCLILAASTDLSPHESQLTQLGRTNIPIVA